MKYENESRKRRNTERKKNGGINTEKNETKKQRSNKLKLREKQRRLNDTRKKFKKEKNYEEKNAIVENYFLYQTILEKKYHNIHY